MNRKGFILVFFTEGRYLKKGFWGLPLKWKLKLIIKNPLFLYQLWLCWFTKTYTRSKFAHVCFSYGDKVIDISAHKEATFWNLLDFCNKYPSIAGLYIILTDKPIDILRYRTPKRPPKPWRSYLKLFTFGLINISGDCVDNTKDVLAQADIKVSWKVTTPEGLHRWLKKQGYKWKQLN